MKLVTENQFIQFLAAHKGAEFCSITTRTMPKLLARHPVTRRPNPYLGAIKTAVRPGMLGASYANAVQNRRESEGHPAALAGEVFKPEALWHGNGGYVSPCLVRHRGNGSYYVVFYPRHDAKGEVKVTDSQYVLPGVRVSPEAIKPYLRAKSKSNTQEVSREVPWRIIAVDSVVSLTVNGETYTIAR